MVNLLGWLSWGPEVKPLGSRPPGLDPGGVLHWNKSKWNGRGSIARTPPFSRLLSSKQARKGGIWPGQEDINPYLDSRWAQQSVLFRDQRPLTKGIGLLKRVSELCPVPHLPFLSWHACSYSALPLPRTGASEMKAKKTQRAIGGAHSIDFYTKFAFMYEGWKNDPINNG